MKRSGDFALRVMPLLGLLVTSSALGSVPVGHYTIADATVVDNKTRLTWQRSVPVTMYNLSDGANYCGTLGAGWRLPTIKELQTLLDDSQLSPPRLDPAAFPSSPSVGEYLSSTVFAGASSSVWYVNFYSGSTGYDSVAAPYNVRCVRTGTN